MGYESDKEASVSLCNGKQVNDCNILELNRLFVSIKCI